MVYEIGLWPGRGYFLDLFKVSADSEEEALERLVAKLQNDNNTLYFLDESLYTEEELESEGVYIDPSLEGGYYPVYLRAENLTIRNL